MMTEDSAMAIPDTPMVYGEGEGGTTVNVPNPLGIQQEGYIEDAYKAWIAGRLFSAIDFNQNQNVDSEIDKVLKMVEQFVAKAKGKFPKAFK